MSSPAPREFTVAECGNHKDRFPCAACGATVPIQCPRYKQDYASSPAPELKGCTVHEFVKDYYFAGDGGDYTPNNNERAMIEDAINGYLAQHDTRAAETELREALTKARDKFREYAKLHAAKLNDSLPDAEFNAIMAKAARNREMAELCDAALSNSGASTDEE